MKKATVKQTVKQAIQKPELDGEGFLVLSGALFWKWRAVDAEYRNTHLGYRTKEAQVADEAKKHPALVRLIAERDALKAQIAVHKKEMLEVQQEIEARLGIKLEGCTIDDKTGRVFLLGDAGKQVKVLPPSPPRRKPGGRKAAK